MKQIDPPFLLEGLVGGFYTKVSSKIRKATGMFLPDADVIINNLAHENLATLEAQVAPAANSKEPSWLRAESLLYSAAKDTGSIEVRARERILHRFSTQIDYVI